MGEALDYDTNLKAVSKFLPLFLCFDWHFESMRFKSRACQYSALFELRKSCSKKLGQTCIINPWLLLH